MPIAVPSLKLIEGQIKDRQGYKTPPGIALMTKKPGQDRVNIFLFI